MGDTVRHVKFGVGVVQDIVEGGKDYEVTVDFEQAGVKRMFASFAKLKKISGLTRRVQVNTTRTERYASVFTIAGFGSKIN